MCSLVLLMLAIHFCASKELQDNYKSVNDDFYWRDLRGDIPLDALPGGRTSSNSTTYIGQVTYNYDFWFGDLKSDGTACFYTGQELVSETKNIKVLCTNQPKKFVWKRIQNELDFRHTKVDRVISVLVHGDACYVGRAHYHDTVVVGTACMEHTGLIFKGGNYDSSFETITFELLIYEPEAVGSTSSSITSTFGILFVILIFNIAAV